MRNNKKDDDPKRMLFLEILGMIASILFGISIWFSWFNSYQESPTRDMFIILIIETVVLILLIFMSFTFSKIRFERSTGKQMFNFIKELIMSVVSKIAM
jgi:hypothetical protein